MNKIIISILSIFFILSSNFNFAGTVNYPVFSQQETEEFYQQLQSEIDKGEKKVQYLLDKVKTRQEILSDIIRLELESAIVMLNVKKNLRQNFVGTQSLNSPLIREKLRVMFKKDLITELDILELKDLVAREKLAMSISLDSILF
jgi:hypothetical protein